MIFFLLVLCQCISHSMGIRTYDIKAESLPIYFVVGSETPDAVTVSCGNPSNGDCLDDYCAANDELHEVRCCSDIEIDNYQQRNDCAVWAESQFLSLGEPGGGADGPGCVHDADLETALEVCATEGTRLCTLEEIQGACTAGTGCAHDGDMIWTSAECSGMSLPLDTTFQCIFHSMGILTQ